MIRRVEPSDHPMIIAWFNRRGLSLLRSDLPEIGFVRNNAAAGFLYETGTNIAIIENIVTNPDAPLAERYYAVREVVKKLLEVTRFKKYKVWAITKNNSISRMAVSFGFERQGWYEILHRGK